MGGYIGVQRTLTNGAVVRVMAWACDNVINGPGCQCRILTGCGVFYVRGIEVIREGGKGGGKVTRLGDTLPGGLTSVYTDPFMSQVHGSHQDLARGVAGHFGEDVTDSLIVDMLYEGQAKRYQTVNYGALVFSDRVNRGTPLSASALHSLGSAPMSTAGFARWLAKHPEYGTLFSSPIFHNPNHSSKTDYSLCQVWTFFPASRSGRFYYNEEESIGIGPDTVLPKKDVFDKLVLDVKARGSSVSDLKEEHLKPTYDDFKITLEVL